MLLKHQNCLIAFTNSKCIVSLRLWKTLRSVKPSTQNTTAYGLSTLIQDYVRKALYNQPATYWELHEASLRFKMSTMSSQHSKHSEVWKLTEKLHNMCSNKLIPAWEGWERVQGEGGVLLGLNRLTGLSLGQTEKEWEQSRWRLPHK